MRKAHLIGTTVLAGLALAAGVASAQEAEDSEEIVVTGTFIRGVAPVGTNVIGVGAEDIEKLGTPDSTQLLARIPQLDSFSQRPTAIGNNAGIIRPPNVRGLPTLVLFNGQRLVPVGELASDPNVNAIPPSVIERVDVIPGGGSALYGSDAVGGVINFVPRQSLDGFTLSAHRGFGDGYDTWGGDIAFGTDWDGGNLIVAYSNDYHTNLDGADRDWYTQDPANLGLTNTQCSPGTVFVGASPYAMPALTPGANTCNLNAFNDIYPDYNRDAYYAFVRQDLTDNLLFDVTAWYARESIELQGVGFFGQTGRSISPANGGVITDTNPYFQPVGAETQQTFAQTITTAGEAFGLGRNYNTYETMGITPRFTLQMGDNWRAVASYNYGYSDVDTSNHVINPTALAAALASSDPATAYNPYNPESNSIGVLASIFGSAANLSMGEQEFSQSRIVVDGTLFTLPGGDVKLAAGYEHITYEITTGAANGVAYNAPITAISNNDRDVDSFFAEVLAPIVGAGNAMPGVRRLDISAAVRHDQYSDGFETTNPQVGVRYEPVDGLTLHANWGESFHAPDLAFLTGPTAVQVVPSFVFPLPGAPTGDPSQLVFLIVGANPGNIVPETSTAWQIGGDWEPASIDGLRVSLTYFDVHFDNRIDYPPIFPPGVTASPLYQLSPSLAQLQAATAGLDFLPPTNLPSLYGGPAGTEPYAIITAYPQNLASIDQTGVDFNLTYSHDASFGEWRASFGGSHYLTFETTPNGGFPATSNLDDGQPEWLWQAGFGVTVGRFTGDVRVDYRGSAPLSNTTITEVDSFATTNFYFSYDLGELGLLNSARLTLNIDNAFDEDPPRQISTQGVAFTNPGRIATIGINTSF